MFETIRVRSKNLFALRDRRILVHYILSNFLCENPTIRKLYLLRVSPHIVYKNSFFENTVVCYLVPTMKRKSQRVKLPPIDWFPTLVKPKNVNPSTHLRICKTLRHFKSRVKHSFSPDKFKAYLRERVRQSAATKAKFLLRVEERCPSFDDRCFVELAELDWRFALTQNARSFADLSLAPRGYSEYLSGKGLVGFGSDCLEEERSYDGYHVVDTFVFEEEAPAAFEDAVKVHFPEGVDLVVANDDGLCSFRVGFPTLKKGGTFVCRFYDDLTEDSVNVLKEMYRVFKRITLIKPVASGRMNETETYVVCKGKKTVATDDSKENLQAFIEYVNRSKEKFTEFRSVAIPPEYATKSFVEKSKGWQYEKF
jgi:23S rRNA U2552 (ribose-2'-O)-methylase RlmE/FtsJ